MDSLRKRELNHHDYERHRNAYIERAENWANKNRDKRREIVLRWYYQHREEAKAKHAHYKKTARGKEVESLWTKPDTGLANRIRGESRRRAGKRGGFTLRKPGDFAIIMRHWNRLCAYCGRMNCKLTEDHMIPLSWGGHDAPWNIVPACQSCHSRKGSKVWMG